MPDNPKRRILRNLTIDEISLVDVPAQEGAVATLLKRHNSTAQRKDSSMSEQQVKELAALKAEVDDLRKQADKFKTLDGLTDSHREHYAKLDEAGRDAFLTMNPVERDRQVKIARTKTEVVYTAADGTEYTKSDDPRLVAMAKSRDEDRKEIETQKAAIAEQELQKRAMGYSHLPGTPQEVMAMLKAVDSIGDKAMREAVIKMLNAHDSSLSRAFKTAADVEGIVYDDSSAKVNLDKMVADQVAKEGITRAAAFAKVLDTSAGQELYEQHLLEQGG